LFLLDLCPSYLGPLAFEDRVDGGDTEWEKNTTDSEPGGMVKVVSVCLERVKSWVQTLLLLGAGRNGIIVIQKYTAFETKQGQKWFNFAHM
jgi:hypothetical protein